MSSSPSTAHPQRDFDTSKVRARRARERAARTAAAAELHSRVLEVVPPIVARHGAAAAYLFGSVSAGSAHASSDVDLVVLGIGPADYWELRHELEHALDRPVDLHTQDDDPVFVTKAIDRGEQIYAQDT